METILTDTEAIQLKERPKLDAWQFWTFEFAGVIGEIPHEPEFSSGANASYLKIMLRRVILDRKSVV